MPTPVFRTVTLLSFTLSVLIGLSNAALAQETESQTKIGIIVSAVVNVDESTGVMVSAAMAKALAGVLNAEIVAGADARAGLPETARNETCLGDTACLVSAGKTLKVDQLLMLIIVGLGDEIKVEATWVNVNKRETALRTGITTATSPEALAAAFSANAQELFPGVPLRKKAIDTPATDDNAQIDDNGTTANNNTVNSSPQTSVAPLTSESNSTGKVLMVGGGVIVAGWLGYGAYRLSECGSFGASCKGGSNHHTQDRIVDTVGVLGTAALSAGLYMLLTADDASEGAPSPAPVAVAVDSDSLGFSFGGRF